ncbi:Nucleolar MIF4G domain-containing protein 1 [Tritrichomonas musculus]|uniref:Nucleolar MIF4G domain-containing protein 1 n=1 Tax=Tritrichomonas musculus TaxID=1915356 RepID=A0ABR2L8J7_9EUKA
MSKNQQNEKQQNIDSEEYDEEEELGYEDFASDSDGIEMPHFVTPTTAEQDDEEIEYYAQKLGIADDNEWDEDSILLGYSKITEGLTSASRNKKKRMEQKAPMIEATRTPDEEAARKDFTGLLNRIAPSNYNMIASRIRESFSSHPQEASIPMFTRCITQRILSDVPLPPIFIDVYSRALQEIPEAIQPTIDELQKRIDDSKCINIRPFLNAIGEDKVNMYLSKDAETDKKGIKVDEEVSQLTKIARQLHMTTDLRRSIFNAVMTAIDIEDAYSKIAKLDLSKTQRKEVPLVIIECCKNEATYNPYYAGLVSYFIKYDKFFVKNLRAALKNTIKLMSASKFTALQIRNISFLFYELIENKSIDLNILKGISLIQQPAQGTLFINILFRELLQKWDKDIFIGQIDAISKMPNFGADMRKFFEQRLKPFVTDKSPNFPKEKLSLLRKLTEMLNTIQ